MKRHLHDILVKDDDEIISPIMNNLDLFKQWCTVFKLMLVASYLGLRISANKFCVMILTLMNSFGWSLCHTGLGEPEAKGICSFMRGKTLPD